MRRWRWQRVGRGVARGLVYLVAVTLPLVRMGLGSLETPWGKNQLRALIVRQANQYLTATLEIGELNGSLLRGIELRDISLTRGSEPVIRIDSVSLSYAIRELLDRGVVLRTLRVTRPTIVAAKDADGRWNLAGLIKRDTE